MTDLWLQKFESRLEHLERVVSDDHLTLTDVIAAAQSALQCLADVVRVDVWLVGSETVECLTARGPHVVASRDAILQASRHETLIVDHSDRAEQLLVTRLVADATRCVLQIVLTDVSVPRASLTDGAQTVLDVMTSFISRQLLTEYQNRSATQIQVIEFVSRLHQTQSLTEAAAVLVQDIPGFPADCRLSFFAERDAQFQVTAVTGVRDPKAESPVLRSLQRLIATNGIQPDEWTAVLPAATESSTESDAAADVQDGSEDLQLLANHDVRHVRLIQLDGADPRPPDDRAVVVVELFEGATPPDERLLQQITSVATPVVLQHLRREKSWGARLIRHRVLRRLVIAVAVVAVLVLVPVRFEVEVSGQIVATDRRRLFAPDHGTIEQVHFTSGVSVHADELLLEMTNADLDLDLRRLQGELNTTAARLTSVQARRATDTDPLLSTEEGLLTQQLRHLRDQLALVQTQADQLQLKAPVSGTIYRSDAKQNLTMRPVQRGQLLAEIVPQDSPWQLDLQIPDRLQPYVISAQKASEQPVPIRYLVASVPEQDWTTQLSDVDNAIQIIDGSMVCRATATLTELPEIDLRPGTSVTARIHCGTRSLGFVLFREVIEFWQLLRFMWF